MALDLISESVQNPTVAETIDECDYIENSVLFCLWLKGLEVDKAANMSTYAGSWYTAKTIKMTDPKTGERKNIEIKLPDDISAMINKLSELEGNRKKADMLKNINDALPNYYPPGYTVYTQYNTFKIDPAIQNLLSSIDQRRTSIKKQFLSKISSPKAQMETIQVVLGRLGVGELSYYAIEGFQATQFSGVKPASFFVTNNNGEVIGLDKTRVKDLATHVKEKIEENFQNNDEKAAKLRKNIIDSIKNESDPAALLYVLREKLEQISMIDVSTGLEQNMSTLGVRTSVALFAAIAFQEMTSLTTIPYLALTGVTALAIIPAAIFGASGERLISNETFLKFFNDVFSFSKPGIYINLGIAALLCISFGPMAAVSYFVNMLARRAAVSLALAALDYFGLKGWPKTRWVVDMLLNVAAGYLIHIPVFSQSAVLDKGKFGKGEKTMVQYLFGQKGKPVANPAGSYAFRVHEFLKNKSLQVYECLKAYLPENVIKYLSEMQKLVSEQLGLQSSSMNPFNSPDVTVEIELKKSAFSFVPTSSKFVPQIASFRSDPPLCSLMSAQNSKGVYFEFTPHAILSEHLDKLQTSGIAKTPLDALAILSVDEPESLMYVKSFLSSTSVVQTVKNDNLIMEGMQNMNRLATADYDITGMCDIGIAKNQITSDSATQKILLHAAARVVNMNLLPNEIPVDLSNNIKTKSIELLGGFKSTLTYSTVTETTLDIINDGWKQAMEWHAGLDFFEKGAVWEAIKIAGPILAIATSITGFILWFPKQIWSGITWVSKDAYKSYWKNSKNNDTTGSGREDVFVLGPSLSGGMNPKSFRAAAAESKKRQLEQKQFTPAEQIDSDDEDEEKEPEYFFVKREKPTIDESETDRVPFDPDVETEPAVYTEVSEYTDEQFEADFDRLARFISDNMTITLSEKKISNLIFFKTTSPKYMQVLSDSIKLLPAEMQELSSIRRLKSHTLPEYAYNPKFFPKQFDEELKTGPSPSESVIDEPLLIEACVESSDIYETAARLIFQKETKDLTLDLERLNKSIILLAEAIFLDAVVSYYPSYL